MFDDITHEKQDLTHLYWSTVRSASGTAGTFLKATDDTVFPKLYYKLSNYDSVHGVVGHECVNELIADRLMTLLGVEHLHYRLIFADIVVEGKKIQTHLCVSKDYKQPGEKKTALDTYYELEKKENESRLAFCLANGWEKQVYSMLLVDYLILNRDRHGANIEVLKNEKSRTIRLAPIFDNGLSLLFSCLNPEAIDKYDIHEDKPVQSYLGGLFSKDTLHLLPKTLINELHPLTAADKPRLFDGLDGMIPAALSEKIWDLIYGRWLDFENFCHNR